MSGRGKRGSGGFLAQIEEAKRKKNDMDMKAKEEEERKRKEKEEPKSSEARFEEVLATATPCDVFGEYLFFLKKLPKLLNNAEQELIHQVRENLKIDEVKRNLSQPSSGEKVNLKGEQYPLLDALSFKLGLCLRNILAPPTQTCLLCEKPLQRNNKPVMVPFHTLAGPELASKFSWECRSCKGIAGFRGKYETNCRVYYSLDQFGNPDMGFKQYPASFKVSAFRCSSEEYCHKRFLTGYMSDLQQLGSSHKQSF